MTEDLIDRSNWFRQWRIDMNEVKSIVKQRFEDSISKAKDQTFGNDASKILEFLLAVGREYEVEGIQNLPIFNFETKLGDCYHGSQQVILHAEDIYLYCEGWAMLEISRAHALPHFHAWNLLRGNVVDTTWSKLGEMKYYFGLIIPSKFVLLHTLVSHSFAPCLLDWIEKNTSVTEKRVAIVFDMLF